MEYLVDFNSLPRSAGIYCIETHHDFELPGLHYVGAAKNIRTRIRQQIKGRDFPAWARRLGEKLVVEILASPPRYNSSEYWYQAGEFGELGRVNCIVKVLETFDHCNGTEIAAAEDKWMADLKPALCDPYRSKGGYKTV